MEAADRSVAGFMHGDFEGAGPDPGRRGDPLQIVLGDRCAHANEHGVDIRRIPAARPGSLPQNARTHFYFDFNVLLV